MDTTIGRFDEQIASLMPPVQAKEYREQCVKRLENVAKARELVRTETALALEQMASALISPDCARSDLEAASLHLQRALSAAAVLDPEE